MDGTEIQVMDDIDNIVAAFQNDDRRSESPSSVSVS